MIDRSGSEELSLRFRRRAHILQSTPKRIVDDVLQACVAFFAQPFQHNCNIVVDRQGGSHASQHKTFDALMSKNNELMVDLGTELVYFDELIKVLMFIDQEGSDKQDESGTFSLPQGKKQGRFKKIELDLD